MYFVGLLLTLGELYEDCKMTVQELIDALIVACEGRDHSKVQVSLIKRYTNDSWCDYETPSISSFGGNEHPFEIMLE